MLCLVLLHRHNFCVNCAVLAFDRLNFWSGTSHFGRDTVPSSVLLLWNCIYEGFFSVSLKRLTSNFELQCYSHKKIIQDGST